MKLVYLAHPLSGDIPGNIERAKRWYKWVIDHYPEVAPIADWILWCQVVSDDDPVYRERGIAADIATIERCDEVWLFGGRCSTGMTAEADAAARLGKTVVSFLWLGDEPPVDRQKGLPGWPPR